MALFPIPEVFSDDDGDITVYACAMPGEIHLSTQELQYILSSMETLHSGHTLFPHSTQVPTAARSGWHTQFILASLSLAGRLFSCPQKDR
jgi:hypothetical protein